MKILPFKKINAFVKGKSDGNPAACIYLKNQSDISENEMQLIAKELKGYVTEVVYLIPEENAYLLKYYSSECEVDFCGHGTIALMYDYIKNDTSLINRNIVNIRVRNDILEVYNYINKEDSVYITAPAAKYYNLEIGNYEISSALNINTQEINEELNLDLINAGLKTLIIPIKHLTDCLNILPDQNILKDFCLKNDIDIILVFSKEVVSNENQYRTRVFAPKFGYLEDPATGSGNSAFGYYLLKNKIWKGQNINIEQNNSHDLYNVVKLGTIVKNNINHVLFGGSAIVKINGEYKIS